MSLAEEERDPVIAAARRAYLSGDTAQAERLLLGAVEDALRVPSRGWRRAVAILANLAAYLTQQGQFAKAEQLIPRATQLLEAHRGIDTRLHARLLHVVALLRIALGQHRPAEAILAHAQHIAAGRPAVPADNLLTLILTARGTAAVHLGRYAEAEGHFCDAAAQLDPSAADAQLVTTDLAICTANLYVALGRAADARAALARASDAQGDPARRAHVLRLRGQVASLERDHSGAESAFRAATGLLERSRGPGHPSTVGCLNDLAVAILWQGRYAEAEPLLRRVLEAKQANGAGADALAIVVNNLAVIFRELGRLDAAREWQRRALEMQESALGPNDPALANTLKNLALVHWKSNQISEARAAASRARDLAEAGIGSDHPLTREIRELLNRLDGDK